MAKIPDCDRCRLYAHSAYLVCSVHPTGPESNTCADFEAVTVRQSLGGSYYAGDWIPQPFPTLQPEQPQALLDEHPLFTGRCPACEMPIPPDPPRCEWHCGHCGWRLNASGLRQG